MRKEDLKGIYYKTKDIERLRERIAQLQSALENSTKQLSLVPAKGTGDYDRLMVKYLDLQAKLKQLLKEQEEQVVDAEFFIADQEDPLLRQILTYRYKDLMQWEAVAMKIGGGNTADSVRKIAERFFDNRSKKI